MALKKIQFIDLIRDWLAGSDTPAELRGTYHPEIVSKWIAVAFDSVLNSKETQKDNLRAEMGMDNWKYSPLTKVFFAEIKKDTDRNKYYSDLPLTPLGINNNQGIRMICYKLEEETQFIPRRLEDTFLMQGVDSNTIGGITFYTVEGINKVYYSGDVDGCMKGKEIMMKLALGFDELEDNDIVTIPDGNDFTMLELVKQTLINKPPADIVNDSTAIQSTK